MAVTIKTLEGENIDILANAAMQATLAALEKEGVIPEDFAIEFADTHVCLMVEGNPFKRMMRSVFGKDTEPRAVVLKAIA